MRAELLDIDRVGSILQFLRAIGIDVQEEALDDRCFLPGVQIRAGALVVDRARLQWPGDLLHEAGHLAVLPAALRPLQSGALHDCELVPHAGEAEAMAWAYAAACAIGLPAEELFHGGGYHGQSAGLIMTFTLGVYPGLHGLMQSGMAQGMAQAQASGTAAYPRMLRWLRE
jgi:hypothetical protein